MAKGVKGANRLDNVYRNMLYGTTLKYEDKPVVVGKDRDVVKSEWNNKLEV